MKPVRIAQIGSGHDHANQTFRSLLKQKELFEVVGFAECNPDREVPELYNAVPRYTVEELLAMPDLEAVAIESEERLSTYVAQRFAEKGVAIHLDKPGAQDLPAFEKLIETAREKKLPFHMGYMYRYNPSVRHLMKMVKNGEMGEIYSVEAQMSCRHPNPKRQWLDQFKGGMMFFLGCHLIDMVLQFQGEPLEVIPYNTRTYADGVDSEDLGFVVFRYEKGVSFVKSCSAEQNGFVRRQLVVCGTKGTYEIKPWEKKFGNSDMQCSPTYMSLYDGDRSDFWADTTQELNFEPEDRYDGMMQDFAEIVRGKENEWSLDYELMLFRTIMKACNA